MNKKIILTILIIIIIIGGIYLWQKNQYRQESIEDKPTEQIMTGSTNGIDNSQLMEIAKQYILAKPQLFLNNDKFVDWNNYNEIGSDFSKVTPQWIVSQKSTIRYVEPDKYPAPYDDLNDKYIVDWFFIPGCEENPESTDKPNWFDDKGYHCLGGYDIRVLINNDLTVEHAKLDALD